jgi:hypothetical protein
LGVESTFGLFSPFAVKVKASSLQLLAMMLKLVSHFNPQFKQDNNENSNHCRSLKICRNLSFEQFMLYHDFFEIFHLQGV